jgi:hypothetical protein
MRDSDHKHLIILQHIPLFLKSHDEPTHEYFNLEYNQRLNLLQRFRNAGVTKVFCGHYHQNAGGIAPGNIEGSTFSSNFGWDLIYVKYLFFSFLFFLLI